MIHLLFKRWHEQLFFLKRCNMVPREPAVPLTYVEINQENSVLVRELRAEMYVSQFQRQLAMGDYGLYACYEGKPVAYGWVKHGGSDDYFFEIGHETCYLCRFYTHESMRGRGIYPALITQLIEHEAWCDHFYIDIERGNDASQKGWRRWASAFIKNIAFCADSNTLFIKKELSNRTVLCGNKSS